MSSLPLSLTTIFGLPRSITSRSSSRATRVPESEVSATSSQALAGAIIDDGEDTEAAALGELIRAPSRPNERGCVQRVPSNDAHHACGSSSSCTAYRRAKPISPREGVPPRPRPMSVLCSPKQPAAIYHGTSMKIEANVYLRLKIHSLV